MQSLSSEEEILVAELTACAQRLMSPRQQHLEGCYTSNAEPTFMGDIPRIEPTASSLMSVDVALQVHQKVTTDIEGIETELVRFFAYKT